MTKPTIFACHGLILGWPVDYLAAWLLAETGLTSTIVGVADPQPLDPVIREQVKAAAPPVIFIGHSKGAMLAYYIERDFSPALTIAIDPTCWGSDMGAPDWSLVVPKPGHWRALGKNRVINIRSGQAPGGGFLDNPGSNPQREDHLINGSSHLSVVNDPRSRSIMLPAIKAVA